MNSAFCVLVAVIVVLVAADPPITCPAYERPECSSRGGDLVFTDCSRTAYVNRYCPYMCGHCQERNRPTCNEDPTCHQSNHGCIWVRNRAPPSYCATHHDRGLCASRGGTFGCARCYRQYSMKQYCPHMCGYC